jgi:hypothetical protein
MADGVHVFLCGRTQVRDAPGEKVRDDVVKGTLFEVEGVGAVLMLAGSAAIRGEVRRVPPSAIADIDARAGVAEGLLRRIGVQVGETACWAWVAGPRLAPRLASGRKNRNGGES